MGNNTFFYRYTALSTDEKKEVESIQNRYKTKGKKETKIERLRRLDREARNVSNILSLWLGLIGFLVFGTGISLCMVWKEWIFGSVVAVVGGISMIISYPIWRVTLKKRREKYVTEILRLAEEILKEENNA